MERTRQLGIRRLRLQLKSQVPHVGYCCREVGTCKSQCFLTQALFLNPRSDQFNTKSAQCANQSTYESEDSRCHTTSPHRDGLFGYERKCYSGSYSDRIVPGRADPIRFGETTERENLEQACKRSLNVLLSKYSAIWVLFDPSAAFFVRHGGSFPAWPRGNGMAGRPAGSRRELVFGRLSASGKKWPALTAAGGRACRCDRAGSGEQTRRLTGLLRPTQEQHKSGSRRRPTREQLKSGRSAVRPCP